MNYIVEISESPPLAEINCAVYKRNLRLFVPFFLERCAFLLKFVSGCNKFIFIPHLIEQKKLLIDSDVFGLQAEFKSKQINLSALHLFEEVLAGLLGHDCVVSFSHLEPKAEVSMNPCESCNLHKTVPSTSLFEYFTILFSVPGGKGFKARDETMQVN